MSRFLDDRLRALIPYTPGEQPRGRRFIKLNTNESPFPPSPEVLRAITQEQVSELRLYSDPTMLELRRAIAQRNGLTEAQVMAGNGSDEILGFAFQAFCGKKGVMFPSISYGFYPVWCQLFGIDALALPLREDFTIDIAPYRIPGRNVVLANPNAPTGLALSLEEIEAILQAHPEDVVLIDQAYVDFGCDSAVKLIDRYENLLVVETFSKSRALAGARIGFAMGQEGLIEDLERVRCSFHPYSLNRLSLLAGAAAMRDGAYFDECRGKIIENRSWTRAELMALGCDVTDSLANFLFVRLPGVPGREALEALRQRGILVRWFDKEGIRDWLRITVGVREEMEALVHAVRGIIEGEEQ